MPLPPFTKSLAEKMLAEYCEKRVPADIRNRLRMTFRFRGNSVTLIEERPPWKPELADWSQLPIAQLRFDGKKNRWKLYCADRNSKWHWFDGFEGSLEACIAEIDRDSTGIFFG